MPDSWRCLSSAFAAAAAAVVVGVVVVVGGGGEARMWPLRGREEDCGEAEVPPFWSLALFVLSSGAIVRVRFEPVVMREP